MRAISGSFFLKLAGPPQRRYRNCAGAITLLPFFGNVQSKMARANPGHSAPSMNLAFISRF
jgi:hypothetical protein